MNVHCFDTKYMNTIQSLHVHMLYKSMFQLSSKGFTNILSTGKFYDFWCSRTILYH